MAHAQTEKFRHNLATICAEHGAIQKLADAAGVHRVYLSKVLHGHVVPSMDIAARIAEAAGLELPDFLLPPGKFQNLQKSA